MQGIRICRNMQLEFAAIQRCQPKLVINPTVSRPSLPKENVLHRPKGNLRLSREAENKRDLDEGPINSCHAKTRRVLTELTRRTRIRRTRRTVVRNTERETAPSVCPETTYRRPKRQDRCTAALLVATHQSIS